MRRVRWNESLVPELRWLDLRDFGVNLFSRGGEVNVAFFLEDTAISSRTRLAMAQQTR